jgi:hypothetical protein
MTPDDYCNASVVHEQERERCAAGSRITALVVGGSWWPTDA